MRYNNGIFACALALMTVGCGPENRGAISGLVTLDGKPIEKGVINFFPGEGNSGPTAGGNIKDGRYQVDAQKGAVLGNNLVRISSMQKTGRKIPGRDGDVNEETVEAVPPQYNRDSTLVREVHAGENELNFDLQGRLPIEKFRRKYPRP